jgi:guanylate kinase
MVALQDRLAPLKSASLSYQTPEIAHKLLLQADPLVIAGVTAAGKNAVSKKLVKRGGYIRVVTNTTRPPRVKEMNGQDYWFTDPDQMFELLKNKLMIETEVIHDNVYGISMEAFIFAYQTGSKPILTIDVNGAMNLRRLDPGIKPIFLIPPSYSEWMVRLGSRSFLSDGERQRRMHSAHLEIEIALRSQDFSIVVNNDLDDTMAQIAAGVPSDPVSQELPRKAAQDLYDYIKTL